MQDSRLPIATGAAILALTASGSSQGSEIIPELLPFIGQVTGEFHQIPLERRRVLEGAASSLRAKLREEKPAEITFICTHNSRRSHLGQVWAQAAAAYYGLSGVRTYSGGTEATACNERTVAALIRAGLVITNSTPEDTNPVYLVTYSEAAEPMRVFSKIYSADGNPAAGFVAAMTCDHADESCPFILGSALRIAIPYVDPKVSDGTAEEAATYDERCREIAREMFYLLKQVSL